MGTRIRRAKIWLVWAVASLPLHVFQSKSLGVQLFGWNNTGFGGDWSVPSNWSPSGPPTSGAEIEMQASGASNTVLDLNLSISELEYLDTSTPTVLFGQGKTLTLDGGTSSSTITLNSPFPSTGTLALGGTLTLQFNGTTEVDAQDSGQLIALGGTAQGSGTIVNIGPGQLRFNGTDPNYTGNVEVADGTFTLLATGGLGSLATVTLEGGTLSLQDSATSFSNSITVDIATGNAFDAPGIITTASGFISGSGGFTKTGNGTLALSHTNNYSGGTTIANGMLTLGNSSGTGTGSVAVNSGTVFNVNSFAPVITELSGAGSVTLGSGTLTSGDGGSSTFSGAISGSGTMVLQGTGTLSLTGTGSSFSGGTFITGGGMLSISADGGLGAAPGSPATNITFSGSGGTLQATSNITLSSDRNVLLSTNAVFDTQANTLTIPGAVSGGGSLTQTGSGTLALTNYSTAAGVTLLGGTFLLSGTGNSLVGINGTAGNVTLASGGSANSDGVRVNTLTINGTWGIHAGASASGVSVLSNLVLATNTSGAYTGTLDIADDKLVVETTGTSGNMATILSSLTAAALSGSGDGPSGILNATWTGSGLTSSTLVSDFNAGTNHSYHTTMAIADNGLMRVPFTSYAGQPVDANSILVTRALLGDANLDNTVDNTDFVVLLTHYGETGQSWATGDFNGDGTVNNTGLVAFMTNDTQSLPGGYSLEPAGDSASAALAGAVPVPEPFSLAAMPMAALLLVRRRRGRLETARGQ